MYTPAVIVAGLNMPPATGEGPLHVPPASGLPPSCASRPTAAPLLQSVVLPSVPAVGGLFTATVTVEVAAGQGAAPATV